MAVFIAQPTININSVDLTNHVDSLTLEETYADVDTTAFSSASGLQNKTRIAGLGDHKLTLEFQQDYAATSVNATIYPLIGTVTTVNFRALTGATSSVNPGWTMSVLVTDWKPFDAKVGDVVKSSVTWPVTGAIVQGST